MATRKRTLVDDYHDGFVVRFGFKPKIAGGKDGKQLQTLAQTWDEKTVRQLLGEFFTSTDPWVLRSDYSVGAFFATAQRLYLHLNGATIDKRAAENLDAAARATKPRRKQ